MGTLRYDDLGSINAVKLLPKIDSYNGYIQLYTELDSHIEIGSNIFITYSGDTTDLNIGTDVILDNYIYMVYSNDFIYDSFAQGYTVIYIDKNINSFVINRGIQTIPPNGKLFGHYVSSVVCNNVIMTGGVVDSTLIKHGILSGNTINQCVMLGGDLENVTINDKYSVNYLSLGLSYDNITNTYTKSLSLNNNNYGYSYFYNMDHSLKNIDISTGNYYNCSISTTKHNKISGGYFDSCDFGEYNIYDGYFKNTKSMTGCVWYYGKWDGGIFELPYWYDGVFINGDFGTDKTVWLSGRFLNGVWKAKTWVKGDFVNGLFQGASDGSSEWIDGNFIGGKILNNNYVVSWKTGYIYGGEINKISINSGNIYGGEFYNTCIKNTNIYDGNFNVTDSYNRISKSKIYGGNYLGNWYNPVIDINVMFDPIIQKFSTYSCGLNEFSDSTIYDGNFKYSAFYNFNTIENGKFEDGLFYSPITVNNGLFTGGKDNIITENIQDSWFSVDTTYINMRSNCFKIQNYCMSKANLRSIYLVNNSDIGQYLTYIEFENGHNFSSGETVKLVGFNSQTLNNKEVKIISGGWYDPTTLQDKNDGNGFVYDVMPSVGVDYIIIDEPYDSIYYGDSGVVRKADYSNETILSSKDKYILNGGTYNNSEFYGKNINIYGGEYNYVKMIDGINFYNGVFNGNVFQSINSGNSWSGGTFNSGVFGVNIDENNKEIKYSINRGGYSNNPPNIINTSNIGSSDYRLNYNNITNSSLEVTPKITRLDNGYNNLGVVDSVNYWVIEETGYTNNKFYLIVYNTAYVNQDIPKIYDISVEVHDGTTKTYLIYDTKKLDNYINPFLGYYSKFKIITYSTEKNIDIKVGYKVGLITKPQTSIIPDSVDDFNHAIDIYRNNIDFVAHNSIDSYDDKQIQSTSSSAPQGILEKYSIEFNIYCTNSANTIKLNEYFKSINGGGYYYDICDHSTPSINFMSKYGNSNLYTSKSFSMDLVNSTITVLFNINGKELNTIITELNDLSTSSNASTVGVQIYSKNVSVSKNEFRDNWYGGQFINGEFDGVWYGGVWNGGGNKENNFKGWNNIKNSLDAPDTFVNNISEKQSYTVDYQALKDKKLYYDIAPWDLANQKKNETVKLPLRKEDRNF